MPRPTVIVPRPESGWWLWVLKLTPKGKARKPKYQRLHRLRSETMNSQAMPDYKRKDYLMANRKNTKAPVVFTWILGSLKSTPNSVAYRGISTLTGVPYEGRKFDESPIGDLYFRNEFKSETHLDPENKPAGYEVTLRPIQTPAQLKAAIAERGIIDTAPSEEDDSALTMDLGGLSAAQLKAIKEIASS